MSAPFRILTQTAACAGHARCHAVAPGIFELDANGYNIVPSRDLDGEHLAAAQRAVRACPERALSIISNPE